MLLLPPRSRVNETSMNSDLAVWYTECFPCEASSSLRGSREEERLLLSCLREFVSEINPSFSYVAIIIHRKATSTLKIAGSVSTIKSSVRRMSVANGR